MITEPCTHIGEHSARPDDGISPYDTCRHCGQAIRQHYVSGVWVTMTGANAECYGLAH